MNTIATKTQLPVQQIVQWCGIARCKFYDWRKRYGKVNEHNGLVPRDHWIEEWERQSVIDYFDCHPLDGYRRLTFMMLDEDAVAVSPSTTYRVLSKAGRLDRWNPKPSKKGTGFVQPLRAHQHWHTDISYLNLGGTFYCLCSFLDGASRAVVHWEIRESMTEADVECILERAKEAVPRCAASNHLGQRSAVHREGLQGIHPHLRDDAREDRAVLPAIEREDRALAQDDKIGRPASCQPHEPRRGSPLDGTIRRILQRGSPAQRDRLHCAAGLHGWQGHPDLVGARPQTRAGSEAAA